MTICATSPMMFCAPSPKQTARSAFMTCPTWPPSPKQPTLDDYMAHLTHALDICGEDHVGVGSDSELTAWDTSPEAMAAFRKDEEDRHKAAVAAPGEEMPARSMSSGYTPRRSEVTADALLKRGYKPRAVEKVLGLNFTDALGLIWQD
jgi:membrane dipeptidase